MTVDIQVTLDKLTKYFRPIDNDPIYLVLKAHLVAEETLYGFLEKKMASPKHLVNARLSFSQSLALARAIHVLSNADWWGWIALEKLNSLRNLLAHNLEPQNTQQRVIDFTLFVCDAIGVTKNTRTPSVVENEFELLIQKGMNPFLLSLLAVHIMVDPSVKTEFSLV